MRFEVVFINDFKVFGLPMVLTQSQIKNFDIITSHWENFNKILKEKSFIQNEGWGKYGITYKRSNNYFYMPSVSFNQVNAGFEILEILKSKYACFEYSGDMKSLKITLYDIYKKTFPIVK